MLTPEYLQRITEGAEEISSSLHRNIMDMIIERIMKRLGRGEDYLLTQTDLDILDICETCGFSNLSHFYHLFQKQFGQSPIRFRREKN